jgi:hypothetical protein
MAFNNQSVLLKARYLEKEHDELAELFSNNYDAFFLAVKKECGSDHSYKANANDSEENNDSSPKADPLKVPSGNKKTFLSDRGLKSIYTRIVTISHPDKHAKHLTDSERAVLTKIYQKCIRAVEEQNLLGVLSCAKSLYLDVPELKDEDIGYIKEECIKIQEKIKNLENTYIMLWVEAEDKDSIIKQFIDTRG